MAMLLRFIFMNQINIYLPQSGTFLLVHNDNDKTITLTVKISLEFFGPLRKRIFFK